MQENEKLKTELETLKLNQKVVRQNEGLWLFS